jgi:thiol-disulfide isomerase/thioredoxin
MSRRLLFLSLLSGSLLGVVGRPAMADPPDLKTLPIGAKAPDFALPGVDGKTYSLKDFADAKALVVAFTCNHCPTAQAYEARFKAFAAAYAPKGVAFVAISPNDDRAVRLDELGYTDLGDSFADMKLRAKDAGFNFPYLYDGETQATSLAYGVLATPHVYVFDSSRTLRYVGRFDDGEVKPPTSHDAIDAVEAVLAGEPVPVATTRVFGCSTKWADKRQSAVESLAKWDAEPVAMKPIDAAGAAALAKNATDKYVLVNLWATWCGPCVQELPELVTIHRMYRGRPFELVTISLDEPDAGADALKVLEERKVAATNYHFTGADKDKLAEALDRDWPGPVPHTILIAPGGEVVYRKTGAFEPLELRRAIVERLGRTYASRRK